MSGTYISHLIKNLTWTTGLSTGNNVLTNETGIPQISANSLIILNRISTELEEVAKTSTACKTQLY